MRIPATDIIYRPSWHEVISCDFGGMDSPPPEPLTTNARETRKTRRYLHRVSLLLLLLIYLYILFANNSREIIRYNDMPLEWWVRISVENRFECIDRYAQHGVIHYIPSVFTAIIVDYYNAFIQTWIFKTLTR